MALLYAGVIGVSFALLFAVIFWSTSRFMHHQIDDSVANELNEIMSEAPADVAATRAMVRGLARESSGFVYLFETAKGEVLAATQVHSHRAKGCSNGTAGLPRQSGAAGTSVAEECGWGRITCSWAGAPTNSTRWRNSSRPRSSGARSPR